MDKTKCHPLGMWPIIRQWWCPHVMSSVTIILRLGVGGLHRQKMESCGIKHMIVRIQISNKTNDRTMILDCTNSKTLCAGSASALLAPSVWIILAPFWWPFFSYAYSKRWWCYLIVFWMSKKKKAIWICSHPINGHEAQCSCTPCTSLAPALSAYHVPFWFQHPMPSHASSRPCLCAPPHSGRLWYEDCGRTWELAGRAGCMGDEGEGSREIIQRAIREKADDVLYPSTQPQKKNV